MTVTVAQTVDVRDMLCAQAIMVVWKATRIIPVGSVLEIVCNAADVREDLLVWARELGHAVMATEDRLDETWLWLRRGA